MCGTPTSFKGQRAPQSSRASEQRRIFLDLTDLKITGYLGDPAIRATATANIYERFAPFADDGWEWIEHPPDPAFDGWVYEHLGGKLTAVGVNLKCRRVRTTDPAWDDPIHHQSEHRVIQLTGTSWTGAVGSKLWSEVSSAHSWL